MTVCVCTRNNCNVNVSTCTMGYNITNGSQPTTSVTSVALASTLPSTPDISMQRGSTRTTSPSLQFLTTNNITMRSEPATSIIYGTTAITPISTINSSTQVGLIRAILPSLQFTNSATFTTTASSINNSTTPTRFASTPTRFSCSPRKAINPMIIGEPLILAHLLINKHMHDENYHSTLNVVLTVVLKMLSMVNQEERLQTPHAFPCFR